MLSPSHDARVSDSVGEALRQGPLPSTLRLALRQPRAIGSPAGPADAACRSLSGSAAEQDVVRDALLETEPEAKKVASRAGFVVGIGVASMQYEGVVENLDVARPECHTNVGPAISLSLEEGDNCSELRRALSDGTASPDEPRITEILGTPSTSAMGASSK